jgi:hypothetical protein
MGSIEPVATTAATLLATKALEALGTKAGETTWAGMSRLVTLVRAKVRGHQRAEIALAEVEQASTNPDHIRMLSEILVSFAAQDRRFRRELATLITQARQDPVVGRLATQVYDQAQIGQILTIGQMRDFHYYAAPLAPNTPLASSPLMQVTTRFMQVYEWHGIHPAEIPDFLEQTGGPSVTLADLSTQERLLERLDSQLLDFTTETFSLHHAWLRQGGAAQILTSLDFYKNVERLADFLLVKSIRKSGRTDLWAPAGLFEVAGTMIFFSTQRPTVENYESQPIYVGAIFEVPIVNFRGRAVCRYYAMRALPWDYGRSHYELVAMMTIADACDISVVGRYLSSKEDLMDLCMGRRFPVELTGGWTEPRETWSLEVPYLREKAWGARQDWCQRKWSTYQADFERHGYEGTILDAKEEQHKAWS